MLVLSIVMDDSEIYVQRMIELGCNRTDQLRYNYSRYNHIPSGIQSTDILDLCNGNFLVESEKKDRSYLVSMISGFCQCPVGRTCGPCKHKAAVSKFRNISGFSVIPENDAYMRALWHYVAVGETQPAYMYENDGVEDDLNIEEFISGKLGETSGIPSNEHVPTLSDDENEPSEDVAEDVGDNDKLAEEFLTIWREYGERVASEMKKGVDDPKWRESAIAAINVMKEHSSYRPTTLMKHMKLFGGPEIQGKTEKGKKKTRF